MTKSSGGTKSSTAAGKRGRKYTEVDFSDVPF